MTSLSLSLSGYGIGEAKDAGAAPLANASSLPVEVTIPGIGDIYATYETTSPIASDA